MKCLFATITLAVCLYGCGKAPPKKEHQVIVVEKIPGKLYNSIKVRPLHTDSYFSYAIDSDLYDSLRVGDTLYSSNQLTHSP